jgi:hypothetical protein
VTGAIFGLVGVIVGGLLTAAVQAFQEWRSQRKLSRAAARLLSAELSVQQEILQRRAANESAEPASDEMPAVADWPEQRVVMARMLDNATWIAVAGAYANLVVWHSENRRTPSSAEAKRREISELADQLNAARKSLQDFRFGTSRTASESASG